MTIKKINVAVYVRVSTQEQAKEGYSIGEQIDRLKKYADAHEWNIVKVYTDAGFSGGNIDRPALQEMIENIKEGKINKVLVYKLDRLSRSQKDTLELIEDIFLANNCDFESITERFDTSTPFGKAMIGILAVFAQLEREQIKERMTMGIYARIKEGKWKGGAKIPFGYDYDKSLNKLVINEYESMIIKELFEKYTAGISLNSIAKEMMKEEKMLNNGKLDKRNLRYFLRNKTYCGYLKHKNEWIKGLHDPIISENVFEQAQKILDRNHDRFVESGYKAGRTAISTNLGGLLYCKKCGARYGKSRSGTKKYGYRYNYSCYSRHKKVKSMIKDPNCKNKIYRIEVLDNIIFDQIKQLAIDPEYIKNIKQDNNLFAIDEKIHIVENQLKQINNQISRFMDLYGLGKFTIEELDEKTTPLQDQRNVLKKQLQVLQDENKKLPEADAIELAKTFTDVLEKADAAERRSIIETLIDRIEIDGDDIYIHWNFV